MTENAFSSAIEQAFTVEPASWSVDGDALRAVREQVFVIGQSIRAEDEWDALDANSRHVLARDRDGQPIGCGRLTAAQTIGRMAVIAEWRGRGVGAALLRALLELARSRHWTAITLHAQVNAQAFYEKAGFEPFGDVFDECGIAHRRMRIALAALPERPQPMPDPVPVATLLRAHDRAQALAAILTLLTAARHEVALLTRDLDPTLLDVPEVLDAFKRIALAGRGARIRVLLLDPRKAVADGHRLIALAQRLPDAISMRTPVDEHDLSHRVAILLNDRGGYFLRLQGERNEGDGSTHAPGRHAQLLAQFDQAWERAVPCAEIRRLGI